MIEKFAATDFVRNAPDKSRRPMHNTQGGPVERIEEQMAKDEQRATGGKLVRRLKQNIWWAVLLAVLLTQHIPALVSDAKKAGRVVTRPELLAPNGQTLRGTDPPFAGRQVIVLWATWCKPCKLQLNLVKGAVALGLLGPGSVIALNTGEDPATVQAFASAHDYPVTYAIADSEWINEALELNLTPTVVFMRDLSQIDAISSGLNTIGLLRAAWYLNSPN